MEKEVTNNKSKNYFNFCNHFANCACEKLYYNL